MVVTLALQDQTYPTKFSRNEDEKLWLSTPLSSRIIVDIDQFLIEGCIIGYWHYRRLRRALVSAAL